MTEIIGSRGELLDGVQHLPSVWANIIRLNEDFHYSYLLPKKLENKIIFFKKINTDFKTLPACTNFIYFLVYKHM